MIIPHPNHFYFFTVCSICPTAKSQKVSMANNSADIAAIYPESFYLFCLLECKCSIFVRMQIFFLVRIWMISLLKCNANVYFFVRMFFFVVVRMQIFIFVVRFRMFAKYQRSSRDVPNLLFLVVKYVRWQTL